MAHQIFNGKYSDYLPKMLQNRDNFVAKWPFRAFFNNYRPNWQHSRNSKEFFGHNFATEINHKSQYDG